MKALFSIVALCGVVSTGLAQCTPSATNFCITHNGIAFVVDGNVQQVLTLTAGTTYTFKLNAVPALHPFYLTNSPTGGLNVGVGSIANVTPNTPQSGNVIVSFSPSLAQVGNAVYYHCANHRNMGARINVIAPPPCPADFNGDSVVDFFDYLDFVDAFSANDPSADFNQDSVIDFFDYLDFVDAFSLGC